MRGLTAITGAIVVGVVVIEALTALLQLLSPETDIVAGVIAQTILPASLALALLAAWFLGGMVAGALGAAACRCRGCGWLAGGLLAVPIVLLVLTGPWPDALLWLGLVPVAGAVVGAGVVASLYRGQGRGHSGTTTL